MSEKLISPITLFNFEVPCLFHEPLWSPRGPMELPETHRMLSFGELADGPVFGDLRMGWCETGLSLSLRVQGKKQLPWCRASRLEDSDGLWLFVDTRNTPLDSPGESFLSPLCLSPTGNRPEDGSADRRTRSPSTAPKRARNRFRKACCRWRSEKRVDGYLLRAAIPAHAMTGFDTSEHTQLGFSYAIVDRELGWQTFLGRLRTPLHQ